MDLTPLHGPPATAPKVPGFVPRTLLGFGAHGEVWLADDLSSGGQVALKIGRRAGVEADPGLAPGLTPGLTAGPEPGLTPGLAAGPEPGQEVALLCRINHPHVVRLQRVVPLPGGGLALVLDLASGGSLASLVAARGRFDPGEVSTLLVPLAGALAHLHRLGVVHGDIAPGNVLFTGDGRPQLADLGVAGVLGTRAGDIWSTPGFTDPALGPGGSDPQAADVWGLAAIAWFALTGRPPDPQGLRIATGDRAEALASLLVRCLTAAPRSRPALSEVADLAWQAARPTPIRLAGRGETEGAGAGLVPLSGWETRRVPVPAPGSEEDEHADARPDLDQSATAGRARPGKQTLAGPRTPVEGAGRIVGGPPRVVPRYRVAGGLAVAVVALTVTAVGVAATVRSDAPNLRVDGAPVAARPTAERTVIAAPGSAPPAPPTPPTPGADQSLAPAAAGTTDGWPESVPDLEAELAVAMVSIGRSRAKAFDQASIRPLLDADVPYSPAHTDDVQLVQRLRSGGYRLRGVRYRITEITVLKRSGEQVQVRALVTTSRHRRVRVGADSQAGVEVPADGPRPVLFSLSPAGGGGSGPQRWRIRTVGTATS